jgi:hypothetical protein
VTIRTSLEINEALYPELYRALLPLGKGHRTEYLRILATEGLAARRGGGQRSAQVVDAPREMALTDPMQASTANGPSAGTVIGLVGNHADHSQPGPPASVQQTDQALASAGQPATASGARAAASRMSSSMLRG